MNETQQASFQSPQAKIRETLEMAGTREYDHVIALVSGGTDSLCAVDAYHRFHDGHDLPPIDLVV